MCEQFESLSQHTSIQTSKAFQLVAQTSSDEMMKWTHKMHEIAIKTKQETLSMHVITIFTLIFLPGTFIAVRCCSGLARASSSNQRVQRADILQQRSASLG